MLTDIDFQLDTVSQLIPPAAAEADIRARYPLPAEGRTLVTEDARPLPQMASRHWSRPAPGRHRAPELPLPGERPTGPIPRCQPIGAQSPEEPTQPIPSVRSVTVPLERRDPGVALAADPVPEPSRSHRSGLLVSLLGVFPWRSR